MHCRKTSSGQFDDPSWLLTYVIVSRHLQAADAFALLLHEKSVTEETVYQFSLPTTAA